PRAALMLLGGAVIDRFSARRVLVVTAAARTVLVGIVAALLTLGVVRLWHIYLLTFAFGVADAFSFPAGPALLPAPLHPPPTPPPAEPQQLQPANALIQSSTVMTQMTGPAPAGIVINRWGTASALFFDAASSLAVIAALWRLPEPAKAPAAAAGAPARPSVW